LKPRLARKSQNAALSHPNISDQSLPNKPDGEPELPLLQAITIALLLCSGLALFVWVIFWFWA
jgi:hypothetical protein